LHCTKEKPYHLKPVIDLISTHSTTAKGNSIHKAALASIIFIVFAYIVVRAMGLSITHDEGVTYKIIKGNIHSARTANNHLLNTWLTSFLVNKAGLSSFLFRLPNVLAFLLYAFYAYKLLIRHPKTIILAGGIVLLFFNPFLLEYFSLARGYGLALAFEMGAFYHFIIAKSEKSNSALFIKNLFFSLLYCTLACYSNLSFINISMCLAGLWILEFVLLIRVEKGNFPKTSIAGILFLFGIYGYFVGEFIGQLQLLKKTEQLYYGGTNGFFHDTVLSLADKTLNLIIPYEEVLTSVGLLAAVFLALAAAQILYSKQYDNLARLIIILFGVIVGIHLEHKFFDSLFPIGRTAISILLLFSLILYFLILEFDGSFRPKSSQKKLGYAVFSIFIILPILVNQLCNINFRSSIEWRYDTNDKTAIDLALAKAKENGSIDAFSISCHWLYEPSLNFYRAAIDSTKIQPVIKDIDLNSDFIYCSKEDLEKIPQDSSYKRIAQFKDTETTLIWHVRNPALTSKERRR
jgi:hypothetical protein